MMKKRFIFFAILFSLITSGFAVTLEAGFQWDTYNPAKAKGVPGFTFDISEQLSENFSMIATIDNLYALNYNAFCGGSFFTENFYFSVAFMFALRNGMLSPGIMLETGFDIGKVVSFEIEAGFAFSPSDFSSNSLIYIEGDVIFHSKNSDLTLSYTYDHVFTSNGFENRNSGLIDILAFEEGFPFKLGIFFGAGAEQHSYDTSFFDLGISAGGNMIFEFGKAGTYILKGESEVFRLLRTSEEKIPFAISFSTKFEIE